MSQWFLYTMRSHMYSISQLFFLFSVMCVYFTQYTLYQPDALIMQIYYFIKLYMFWTFSLPIIRSFLLYIRHW